MIRAVPVLIIFGKMHLPLISQNQFTHEIKCDGMTSFEDFMCYSLHMYAKKELGQ